MLPYPATYRDLILQNVTRIEVYRINLINRKYEISSQYTKSLNVCYSNASGSA